jgi:hypothetical protein
LQLDSAAFEQGTNRARRQTEEFGSSAEQLGFKIGSMIRTMIGAGAALAASDLAMQIKDVVQQSLEYADGIAKAAQISNATAAEFQRAAYAAGTLGISSEKLSDIYKDVNDKIGEFLATGGGEMKDFFTQIAPKVGVTAEAFRGLSGPEALQLYVKTLERAGVSQQQATFYMEALANDATALLPLLRNNGAEMDRLGEAAASMGIVMDDAMIRKAQQAKQQMGELGTVLQARLAVFVVDNSDKILDLTNGMMNLTDRVFSLIGRLRNLMDLPVIKWFSELNRTAGMFIPVVSTVETLTRNPTAQQAVAAPRRTGPLKGQDGLTSPWTALWQNVSMPAAAKASSAADKAAKSLGLVHSAGRMAKAAVVELPPALELTAQQLRMLDAGGTAAAASLQKLLGGAALTKGQSKLLTDKMASLKAELFPEQKALEDYQKKWRSSSWRCVRAS